MSNNYDFLIVGAGLFGSTCTNILANAGYKVLIIDKRNHIGGACYSQKVQGIDIHKSGIHIFYTQYKQIYNWIKRFDNVIDIQHTVKSKINSNLYTFPINLQTLKQIFGIIPKLQDIPTLLNIDMIQYNKDNYQNVEQKIISQYGQLLYQMFFKGYTNKQYRRQPNILPESIIQRIPPIRLNYNNSYYMDYIKYICIPQNGYDTWFTNLLCHPNIDIVLNCEYNKKIGKPKIKTIYTGRIDQYYDYQFGQLQFISLDFQQQYIQKKSYQEVSVVNHPQIEIPYLRSVQYKKLNNKLLQLPYTIIVKQFPSLSKINPLYPINTMRNNNLFDKYKQINNPNIEFCGRLGNYRYNNMADTIQQAFGLCNKYIQQQ